MEKKCSYGVKYNAGKLTHKSTKKNVYIIESEKVAVNVDWLSFRIKNPEVLVGFVDDKIEIEGYIFVKRQYGTPQFIDVVDVWHEGYKIANIQYNARMAVLKDSAIVKYENWVWYCTFYRSFTHILIDDLLQALDSNILNISRLDVCADGVEFDKLLLDTRLKQKYRKVGSSKLRVYDSGENTNYGLFGGFYVGQPSSEKFIRYYNKTKEITESSGKKYILDYFEKNGIVGQYNEVKRLEIQLDSKYMSSVSYGGVKYQPDELLRMLLGCNDILKGFFLFSLYGTFEFKYNTGKRLDKEENVEIWKDNFVNPLFNKIKKEELGSGLADKIVLADMVFQMAISEDVNHFDSAVSLIEKKIQKNFNLKKWLIYKQEYLVNKALRKAELNDVKIIEKGNLFDYINLD